MTMVIRAMEPPTAIEATTITVISGPTEDSGELAEEVKLTNDDALAAADDVFEVLTFCDDDDEAAAEVAFVEFRETGWSEGTGGTGVEVVGVEERASARGGIIT